MKNIILLLLMFLSFSTFSQNEIALSIFDSALNKVKKDDINGALSDCDLALKKTNNDSITVDQNDLNSKNELEKHTRINKKNKELNDNDFNMPIN